MNQIKQKKVNMGFTLIELIISLAIAAIVGVTLTILLNQSYASQQRFESLTDLNSHATLFFTQLERDLMGATIPIENILTLNDQKKKGAQQEKNKEATQEPEKTAATPEKQETKKDESPYKAVERVFYCMQKKDALLLSWISRNPLQLYWGSSVGEARPRMARIMYRLEPDPNNKTIFKLIRSEGFDLTYTPYEKHTDQKYKGNVLINGIKNITVTLVSLQEKKDEKTTEDKNKTVKKSDVPPVFEVKKLESWEWPRSTKEEQKKESGQQEDTPPLPHGIHIRLTLWDDTQEKEMTFESAIAIPSIPHMQQAPAKENSEKRQAEPTGEQQKKENSEIPKIAADSTTGNSNKMPEVAPFFTPIGTKPKNSFYGAGGGNNNSYPLFTFKSGARA